MESFLVTGDGSDTGGNASSALPPSRYTEIFEKVVPFYLSIGMTWDQFWNQDSTMVKYFREAEKIRVNNRNTEMWIQGAYIYKVMEAFAPILPAFPKKNARVGDYLSEPLSLSEEEEKSKEERKARRDADKGIKMMNDWMQRVNNKRKGAGGDSKDGRNS